MMRLALAAIITLSVYSIAVWAMSEIDSPPAPWQISRIGKQP